MMTKVGDIYSDITHMGMGDNNFSKNTWINDSGVTHHITFDSKHLLKYMFFSCIPYIIIVDGSHTHVVGCGDIEFQSFKLKDMLHVLGLLNNRLSVHKITKDNNCAVIYIMHELGSCLLHFSVGRNLFL